MMRSLVVAKHDFENARRSFMLWGVVLVFTFFVVLVTAVPGLLSEDVPGELAVELPTLPAGLFVPVTAVIASYLAVAGERESGQLNILLSLPPSRLDVVIGKFLGRSAVVLVAILVAFLAGTVVSVPLYDGFPIGAYLMTMGLTALLGLAFVGIAVGISATTTTRTRAMAPAVGVVILFATGIWSGLMQAINIVADLGFDTTLEPETIDLLRFISPSTAYNRLFNSVVAPELVVNGERTAFGTLPPDLSGAPFYLQDWFVLLMLVAWIVVPVALGYIRFNGADIG